MLFCWGKCSWCRPPGYMEDVGVHVDVATYKADSGMWGSTHEQSSAPGWLKQARDEGGWRA